MAEIVMTDTGSSERAIRRPGRFAPLQLTIGAAVALALAVGTAGLGWLLLVLPQPGGSGPSVSVFHAYLAIASVWLVAALVGGLGAVTVVRWPRQTACAVGLAVVAGIAVVPTIGLLRGRDLLVPELMAVWLFSAVPLTFAVVSALKRPITDDNGC